MRGFLLLILCLLPALAGAGTIYRYVDQDGNVVFTDTPRPGAKKVDLPPLSTYKSVPVPPSPPAADAGQGAAGPGYQAFAITEPGPEATIRSNEGKVGVTLSLTPALDTKAGDRIVVELDGRPYGDPTTASHVELSGVDRGAHTVSARVVDAGGATVISAGKVTFYLHHASILFPNRAKPLGGTPAP